MDHVLVRWTLDHLTRTLYTRTTMTEYSQDHHHQSSTPSIDRRKVLGLVAGIGFGLLATTGCDSQVTTAESYPTTRESTVPAETTTPRTPEVSDYERGTPWKIDFRAMPDGPIDPAQWNFSEGRKEADYNGEEQTYTSHPKNVRIENGALVIEAHTEEADGQKFTSARINTLGIFDFDYGTIEINAALPKGRGTWPAAWLMPSDPKHDPRELGVPEGDRMEFAVNGEIDFLEAIGRHPGEILPAAHSYNQLKKEVLYTPGKIDDPYTKFHRYGLIKKPGSLEFTIDGDVYASRTQESNDPLWWPFEQSYYLILSQAMGGPWAGAEGIDMTKQDQWQYRIKQITYTPLKD